MDEQTADKCLSACVLTAVPYGTYRAFSCGHSLVDIGLSIVQGSGIGHTLYIIMKSDLSTLSALNDNI